MTYLTPDRDTLAKALSASNPDPYTAGASEDEAYYTAFADALIASGAVVSAATLADDEALNDRLWGVLDEHGHNGIDCRPEKPMDYTVTTMLRALAAALTERAAR